MKKKKLSVTDTDKSAGQVVLNKNVLRDLSAERVLW